MKKTDNGPQCTTQKKEVNQYQLKTGMNSVVLEVYTVPDQLMSSIILIMQKILWQVMS